MKKVATMNGFVTFIEKQEGNVPLDHTGLWETCPYGLYMNAMGLGDAIEETVNFNDPFHEGAGYYNTLFTILDMGGKLDGEAAMMQVMYGFHKYDFQDRIVTMPRFESGVIETFGGLKDLIQVVPEITQPKMRLVA